VFQQDKYFIQDKIILRPKILFEGKSITSTGMANTRDQLINRSSFSKNNKIGASQQRRIFTAQENPGKIKSYII